MKQTRRDFMKLTFGAAVCAAYSGSTAAAEDRRPNILIAISDDQSWPHTSFAGCKAVKTPAFDRVAREGVYFTNAFCASPGCGPSRASLLTGRYPWMNEQAGTHASSFPQKFAVYPDILEENGYFVGYTRKGLSPGNWEIGGCRRNPAGNCFDRYENEVPAKGIKNNDYTRNFEYFLEQRPAGKPFCFWYGGKEPHRPYEEGSGLKAGKKVDEVAVPGFLPDNGIVRSDFLDYYNEIEWFDLHLNRMMKKLEEIGELDNTIIVVTGDNGMPFPRAKANCYESGIHPPLAIRWPAKAKGGRVVQDLVSFVDLAPTFLEAAGVRDPNNMSHPNPMIGKSLMNILLSDKQGLVDPSRETVFAARERHSSARWQNLGYPQRAMRTQQYLYIYNFTPERWPAGAPQEYVLQRYGVGKAKAEMESKLGPMHGAYADIDDGPTKAFLTQHADDPKIKPYLDLAVARRPAEEMFDIRKDPDCLKNLAADPAFQTVRKELHDKLFACLEKTKDPRVLGYGEVFDGYIRFSKLRSFPEPDWAKSSSEDE